MYGSTKDSISTSSAESCLGDVFKPSDLKEKPNPRVRECRWQVSRVDPAESLCELVSSEFTERLVQISSS